MKKKSISDRTISGMDIMSTTGRTTHSVLREIEENPDMHLHSMAELYRCVTLNGALVTELLRAHEELAVNKYKELEAQLLKLIKKRKDESDEGDALREKMDALWFLLPEEARREKNKNISWPKMP